MAKRYIGPPLGGMIALCALLLLAPDTYGQTAIRRTFTISGTVGVSGVTMQGFPTPVATDDNGVYTAQVAYGWSGTIKPIKPGYTFLPPEKPYTKVLANMTREDYKPTALTFTISGSVGLPGVKMTGFPEDVVSDPAGRYTTNVVYNWSGTVIPEKTGYRFEPSNRSYNQVVKETKNDDYKSFELTITVSGVAGTEAGVVMKGFPKDPMTGPGGAYRVEVPYGWTGKVKPTKEGVQFSPEERAYAGVTENQMAQDYTARIFTYQISGTTGLAGVIMKGLPEDPMTDNNGYYSATVSHGWIGKVIPEKAGYQFEPPTKDYPKITANRENQDYKASMIYLTIAGTAGTGGVTLSGLPGDPPGDSTGTYTGKVPFGWSGTVTPKKDGWSFEPPSHDYSSVAQNQLKQDFKATPIAFKITGNIGLPQVTLQGLPGAVVTGADGSYSVDVGWNWSGTVTPRKDGYTFDPALREYKEVQMAQSSQDYVFRMVQHVIPGRIVDDTGKPVPDVAIVAENDGGSTTTDANGQFTLKVNHRWQGKITLQKDGYTFTPPTRTFPPVTADMPELAATAKIRMLIITDRITSPVGATQEPIAGVKVTADPPGKTTVVTDSNGKYTVRVPYGWTGVLKFEHPEFVFDPNTKPFTNVTSDIDNTNPNAVTAQPATTQPATTQPATTQPATTQPATTQPATTQPATTQLATTQPATTQPATTQPVTTQPPANEQRIAELQQQLKTLTAEEDTLKKAGKPVPTDLRQKIAATKKDLSTLMVGPSAKPQPPERATQGQTGVPSEGTYIGPNLHSVLLDLARRTGVSITWDLTVKSEPVQMDLTKIENLPLAQALQMIAMSFNPPYAVAVDDQGRAFKVYRPITNTFPGVDLLQALNDLSAATGATIIPDPNVTGQVNVSFSDVSLDDALEMLLAGKPYVAKKMPKDNPRWYLVAERRITSVSFPEISETRRIRLNYMQAPRAKALLSPVFFPYVQAELNNPRDPNDTGNTLLITAAPGIIDRIADDIKKIDVFRRQVLLDTRVVTMERGDLLNLGVEWSWPTIKAGTFTDRVGTTDTTGNRVVQGGWPYGVQIGYAPDKTFTDSLMMALNLLQENSQADIVAKPQVVAQDGRQAEIRVIQEEWFMMQATQQNQFYYQQAQLQKIESGTVLSITPYIGDNNDITIQMAVEVSDSIPKARGSDLPLVTRRTARNAVTVRDGGTVAVGGLTENRSKTSEKRVPGLSSIPILGPLLFTNRSNDKASREVAVFVTAHLVPQGTQVGGGSNNEPPEVVPSAPVRRGSATSGPATRGPVPGGPAANEVSSDDEYRAQIQKALAGQGQQ